MKGKGLIVLAGTIALVLAVLAGCGPATSPSPTGGTPTPTAPVSPSPTATVPASPTAPPVQEASFNALSPRGIALPVQIIGLAERPATLDGLIVYVNQGEADPVIMPALWERVQVDMPKVQWKYIASSGFGPTAPETAVLAEAKAVIRGISW